SPRNHLSPFFTSSSPASTSPKHLCTYPKNHPGRTREPPLTHAGTTSHLFSHLLHQQTLHPRTSALTQHAPTS
ncbi:MAG: hypothetical protein PHV91_09240, partial [Bacteroidales bacterium]|nr:hypothetical protein [Bacteroidales bacterium]